MTTNLLAALGKPQVIKEPSKREQIAAQRKLGKVDWDVEDVKGIIADAYSEVAKSHPELLESLSPEDATTMAFLESSLRPGVTNKLGYKGLFQFGDEAAKENALEDPLNPWESSRAALEYWLKRKGSKEFKGGLDAYLSHQQGASGYDRLKQAAQSGMTVEQLAEKFGTRAAKALISNPGAEKSAWRADNFDEWYKKNSKRPVKEWLDEWNTKWVNTRKQFEK